MNWQTRVAWVVIVLVGGALVAGAGWGLFLAWPAIARALAWMGGRISWPSISWPWIVGGLAILLGTVFVLTLIRRRSA